VAVPALHLSRPDTEYPIDAHLQALASHLVYGAVTELAFVALRRLM
jgi:hypothetical protein